MLVARHCRLPSSCSTWGCTLLRPQQQRGQRGQLCEASRMEPVSAAIVWFRRDLRITDHEPLHEACKGNFTYLIPVYCMDPDALKPRWKDEGLALPQLGPHRCKFLLQALQGLQASLQGKGSRLLFLPQAPQVGLAQLVQRVVRLTNCQHLQLLYHMDVLPEAVALENKVQAAFEAEATKLGVSHRIHAFWSLTLYHPDDLPYSVFKGSKPSPSAAELERPYNDALRYGSLPPVMTQFRKRVQATSRVRPYIPAPVAFPSPVHNLEVSLMDSSDSGTIPTSVTQLYRQAGAEEYLANLEDVTGAQHLREQHVNADHTDPRTAAPFRGGENEGMARLRYYLWGQEQGAAGGLALKPPAVQYFKNTRMQAFGVDNSTKLSPFLALGCISPRMVHAEVRRLQVMVGQESNPEVECEWLIMHLCIRDFFIFTAMKEGDAMMTEAGIKGQPIIWKNDMPAFKRWAQGRTGLPFVDACMRELAATGYMSNRGRQNVASFLTKDLLVNWKLGAELFESLLLDHDVAVNYCNWNYFAGVGNDPRNRHFKTVTQGMKYDSEAQLIKSWLPELRGLPVPLCHKPFSMPKGEAATYSFDLLEQYVEPLVDPQTQIGME